MFNILSQDPVSISHHDLDEFSPHPSSRLIYHSIISFLQTSRISFLIYLNLPCDCYLNDISHHSNNTRVFRRVQIIELLIIRVFSNLLLFSSPQIHIFRSKYCSRIFPIYLLHEQIGNQILHQSRNKLLFFVF
jgi:hypothetical protein